MIPVIRNARRARGRGRAVNIPSYRLQFKSPALRHISRPHGGGHGPGIRGPYYSSRVRHCGTYPGHTVTVPESEVPRARDSTCNVTFNLASQRRQANSI
eukprot:486826-Hanusia_phi.AAC.2